MMGDIDPIESLAFLNAKDGFLTWLITREMFLDWVGQKNLKSEFHFSLNSTPFWIWSSRERSEEYSWESFYVPTGRKRNSRFTLLLAVILLQVSFQFDWKYHVCSDYQMLRNEYPWKHYFSVRLARCARVWGFGCPDPVLQPPYNSTTTHRGKNSTIYDPLGWGGGHNPPVQKCCSAA